MSHLKVVGGPEPPKPRKWMKPKPALSDEQDRAAKAAIRALATKRFKNLAEMSRALGYNRAWLSGALSPARRVNCCLLVRVVLLCAVPLESLVTPGPREVIQ